MNKKQKFFAWLVVIWDAVFLLLAGSSLAYDYNHPHFWSIALNLFLFFFWALSFISDTERLRQR